MIVVDTNVIAYLLLGGEHTPRSRRVFQKDPAWVAPLLWRSEFRSILRSYMQQGSLALADSIQLMQSAEMLFRGTEYSVDSSQVLALVAASRCSAYDCEFVALARDLGVPLVTSDNQILTEFSPPAVSLETFASR